MQATEPLSKPKRLMSLDALRGFDMFLIIGGKFILKGLFKAVNCPFLNTYLRPQFEHADYGGTFRFWDSVLPIFFFIVGVAIPFSLSKRIDSGESKAKIYRHIFKRFLVLFLLGMVCGGILQFEPPFTTRFFSNPLNAIAEAYVVAAILTLNFSIIWQAIITAFLLIFFWALVTFVPVPGYGPGILIPPEATFVHYIDKLIFGKFTELSNFTWVLRIMTFTCTMMLGVFTAYLLRAKKKEMFKFWCVLCSGIVTLIAGLIWGKWFMIDKTLYTSSTVLFTGGLSMILLALFYLIIDIWGLRKWAFAFVVIGMNSIFAYVIIHFVNFDQIGDSIVSGLYKWVGPWNDFTKSLIGFAVLWLVMYYMYRNKTFLKV